MSARVTALVWARYQSGGGEMLLALALADQCTDAGEYIAIDVARLSKKTRQAERTVRDQLRAMVAVGWMEPMEGSKAYRIAPAWLGGSPVAETPKPKAVGARGSRLAKDWALPTEWAAWALKEFPAWTAEFVAKVADRFKDHWLAASGQSASKVEWDGAWRNWCRKEPAVPPAAAPGAVGGEWWNSNSAIDKKGAELGVTRIEGELWHQWRDRVYRAAGDGPWLAKIKSSTTQQGFQSVGKVAAQLQQGAKSAAT